MKNNHKSHRFSTMIALLLTLSLCCVLVGSAVLAEPAKGIANDTNPAIHVAQTNSASVVGVITNTVVWSQRGGEQRQMLAQGSGVVIQDGYVLTNNHVIENGNSYQVILPSGEYADAELVGTDASTDLAVLKVDSRELKPVQIGVSSDLLVGSTVIAIGNPGGEVLANTVTGGIVSALERTSINTTNTTRSISYIQHDAAINSGNSGGGLFDINGNLIGINTLKYGGSVFSTATFEGLGFAIPVDTAYPIAMDLIQYGKVQRPQLGVTVVNCAGPEAAMSSYPPASVFVYSVVDGGPAVAAGLQPYDFITEIGGVRVTTLAELTTELDKHKADDVVTLTVVRYDSAAQLYSYSQNVPSNRGGSYGDYGSQYGNQYGDYYGNYGGQYGNQYGNSDQSSPYTGISGPFQTLKLDVTLKVLQ